MPARPTICPAEASGTEIDRVSFSRAERLDTDRMFAAAGTPVEGVGGGADLRCLVGARVLTARAEKELVVWAVSEILSLSK